MWTPRSLELTLGLALATGPVWAQGLDARAERERIAGERARIEARAAADRSACRAQFAVAACVERVDSVRRDELRALDRQRSLLAEAERKERAVARESRVAERRRQNEASRAALPGPAAKPARNEEPPRPPTRSDRGESKALAASAAEAQAARRVQAAQRRMAEIEAHRAAVEQRNLAAQSKPGAALPASEPR